MSIDSFNLAPAQNTQAGATTTNSTPNPSPTGPAPAQNTPRKQKTTEPGPTVAGVVVPGAALTGLISLCWLIHQFGLPAVLLGIGACAAAATAALVLKARKGTKRVSAARKAAARAAGGGGPGRTVLNRSAGAMRKPTGSRAGGPASGGSAGRRTGSTTSGAVKPSGLTRKNSSAGTGGSKRTGALAGSAAAKPAGLVKPKKFPTRPGPSRNQPQKATGTGLLSGLTGRGTKTPGGHGKKLPTPRTPKNTTPATGGRSGQGTPKTATAPRTTSPTPKSGKAGLLSRIAGRKTVAPTPAVPGKSSADLTKKLTGSKTSRKLTPISKAARANTSLKKVRTPKTGHLTAKTLKPVTGKKAAAHKKKGKKPATLTHKPTAHMSRLRHASYLAGVKLRKHTSKKTRMRIRRVISPARTAARTTNRLLSPPLAHAWRWGTRAFLNWHMTLGTFRYTDAGPNWMRSFVKFVHVIYSPAARAVAATGSWQWLNRWMYQHTSGPTAADRNPTRPTTGPNTDQAPAESDSWGGMFRVPFTPPTEHTSITTPTGAATVSEYTAPLEQAVDAVRQAGAMLLTNPADNMVGYEATLRALADLQAELGNAFHAAGESTRENFKVNPAIAEAYDDTASYASSLAGRLEEIPVLYRTLHAEQVENIENPTVQARKWDISANE